MALSPIKQMRKTGAEPFRTGGIGLGFTLLDFWQWAASDLVGNTTRGRLAEFIVARALGLGITDLRNEWESFDLVTPSNLKVEVKSAAYIQSWFQKSHSNICFVVSTRRGWDSS